MEYGEKIAALRKERGMTQAELGDELNVTYQAVSKWERNESYPNFETMSRIAKLFGVPLSYFEEDGETEEDDAEGTEEEEESDEEPAAMLGMCTVCGKVVHAGEEQETEPKLICAACHARAEKQKAAQQRAEEERRARVQREMQVQHDAAVAQAHHKRNVGLIVAGLVTALVLIIGLVSAVKARDGAAVGGCILTAIFVFTFTAQMIWGGLVRDICCKGGVIVGTPGVIFTLDLDGLIFLAAVKILFAVIRMLVYILFLLFFAAVAFLISPFVFIPKCIRVCRGIDTDD